MCVESDVQLVDRAKQPRMRRVVPLAPDPSTTGLVATGIGLLGGVAWWRSRKR
jgi:hypothetical protein